jgi:hypothetical protein
MVSDFENFPPLAVAGQFTTGAYDTAHGVAQNIKDLYDALTAPNANPVTGPDHQKTREEFFQAHRTPHMSLEDAQNAAEKAARSSPEHQDLMSDGRRTAAEALVSKR